MRRAFVTGGTGFVGINLIHALRADGWEVTALHRPRSDVRYLAESGARLVSGDVTDPDSLRAVPEGLDAVFHVAASLNMWSRRNARQTRVNVDGTRNMVRASLEKKARRFVHTSSIAAYGRHTEPVDERTPQKGADSWVNYLKTKALAEVEVRRGIEQGLDAVILNPSNILGPYDKRGWARMIRLAWAGKLPAVPPGAGSFCHVREVARAHVSAFDRGGTGENYLLGGTDASYADMVREISEVIGRPVPARVTPAWLLRFASRLASAAYAVTRRPPRLTPEGAELVVNRMTCRSDKAMRELDYRPVPLREMVEDSVRWLRDAGMLDKRSWTRSDT